MQISDLKKYCDKAVESYATHAKPIHPSTVVTDPWVRFKCQFGCRGYGKSYGCPPDTPTPEQPNWHFNLTQGSVTTVLG